MELFAVCCPKSEQKRFFHWWFRNTTIFSIRVFDCPCNGVWMSIKILWQFWCRRYLNKRPFGCRRWSTFVLINFLIKLEKKFVFFFKKHLKFELYFTYNIPKSSFLVVFFFHFITLINIEYIKYLTILIHLYFFREYIFFCYDSIFMVS